VPALRAELPEQYRVVTSSIVPGMWTWRMDFYAFAAEKVLITSTAHNATG